MDRKSFLTICFSVITLSLALLSCNNSKTESNTLAIRDTTKINVDNTKFDFLPTSTTNQIIVHDNYTLSYNEKYEQAEWVAYHLTKNQLVKNHFERPFFIEDPKVKTHSADWRNYKKSGYDKGHLCPAGDMKFSQQAFDDTFFTSNISPKGTCLLSVLAVKEIWAYIRKGINRKINIKTKAR